MSASQTVLLAGATGRTGRRVLDQLLQRGVAVRAVVRARERLPAGALGHPGLSVVEAGLLSLGDDELSRLVRGCSAVVSCLGHLISLAGIFGPPRDLVASATRRLCRAIEASRPAGPVRLVLMSSVSVERPGGLDARRGAVERGVVRLLRAVLPPAEDNQRAADFLQAEVGEGHPAVEWVVVRPDTLVDGEVSAYALHEGLVSSLVRPRKTAMANVAHFMCELVTDPAAWAVWKGRYPVIVDREAAQVPASRMTG